MKSELKLKRLSELEILEVREYQTRCRDFLILIFTNGVRAWFEIAPSRHGQKKLDLESLILTKVEASPIETLLDQHFERENEWYPLLTGDEEVVIA